MDYRRGEGDLVRFHARRGVVKAEAIRKLKIAASL